MTRIKPKVYSLPVSTRSNFLDDFDQLVDNLLWSHESKKNFYFTPACDILENDEHYLISFDMPGVNQSDIKIDVADNQLTISGEKKRAVESSSVEMFQSERSYGAFQRTFDLPKSIDVNKVEAHFDNGVLSVAIPKSEGAKAKSIEIRSTKTGIFSRLLGASKDEKELGRKVS